MILIGQGIFYGDLGQYITHYEILYTLNLLLAHINIHPSLNEVFSQFMDNWQAIEVCKTLAWIAKIEISWYLRCIVNFLHIYMTCVTYLLVNHFNKITK